MHKNDECPEKSGRKPVKMLEKAGIAAVMANGMPQIKAIGSIVSEADCDHDGVAEILETLGI